MTTAREVLERVGRIEEKVEQLEFLASTPRARATDPSTAKRAALRMAPAAHSLEAQILDLLSRYRGGLTKDGVCERLKVDPRRWPSVASALTRMRNAGKLRWVGEPVENQNVWALLTENVETGDAL